MSTERLLISVAEQLKVPLTVIARQTEVEPFEGKELIRSQAVAAISLVDSYLLGLQLMNDQTTLELQPVSLASTVTDTAHELDRFARQYQVHLEVEVSGRQGPVMSHPRGLKSALLSLGFAMIETQAAQALPGPKRLIIAAHHTPKGIVSGMYGQLEQDLGREAWKLARGLYGRARQPIPAANPGPAAGLFVADTIFHSLKTRLRVGRYQTHSGLAATFQSSSQLSFV